jgi:hypothetical protein
MGAFNVVRIKEKCNSCGNFVELRIQFKYGTVRQYEYEPGDSLIWGANDEGEPGHKRVVADAVAEHCPVCNAEGKDYEIWLEHDRIVAVKPSSGKYDFNVADEPYIVLEE